MYKVSLILPSLNVARYVDECLKSAVNQELKDIEIICVDAGSTDGTLEIIRDYAKQDKRIKVVLSDKKSYGYQMNLGIQYASGEYIGILETDDFVPKNMYRELYEIAERERAEIVKADFYRFRTEGERIERIYNRLDPSDSYYGKIINPAEFPQVFRFIMNTWSGIYLRSFLKENGIVHNETPGASYQDNGFWFKTFCCAKRIYFVDKPYYMNRRDNEASSVANPGKVYCMTAEWAHIYDWLKADAERFRTFIGPYTLRKYHKPYMHPEDPLYVPLQVGAVEHTSFCSTRDDSGKNISEKNNCFCELTALYWMRYNSDADILGLVHYRRYFASRYPTHRNKWKNILSSEELETILQNTDLLLPRKRNYLIETTFSHYAHAHHEKDLHTVRAVIHELCPQYLPAFDVVMRKRSGHRFNIFVMKRDALHDYCDWLFPILFELEKRIDISDYDEYNKRVFGFIGERLLDVWLMNRDYTYAERKILEIEKTNWIKKGSRFVWRKMKGIYRKSKERQCHVNTCKYIVRRGRNGTKEMGVISVCKYYC